MADALRILQAGDLRLHESLAPTPGLPPELRSLCSQSVERAAIRLFDSAINQNADLLVLAGQLADFSVEPRLLHFLQLQFRRLQQAGVDLLLADDRRAGDSSLLTGGNVYQLSPGMPARFRLGRSGHDVSAGWNESLSDASLQIRVFRRDQRIAAEYLTHAGASAGPVTAEPLQRTGPNDSSPGRAWLFTFSGQRAEPVSIETEIVAWMNESIAVAPGHTPAQLQAELQKRCERMGASSPELILAHWTLTGSGSLLDELNPETFLGRFHNEHAHVPEIWVWKCDIIPEEQFAQAPDSPVLRAAWASLDEVIKQPDGAEGSAPVLPSSLTERGGSHQLRLHLFRILRNPSAGGTREVFTQG